MGNRPIDTYGFGWCLKINNSNFMQIFFGLGVGGNAFQYRKAFKPSGSAAEWGSWKTIATKI